MNRAHQKIILFMPLDEIISFDSDPEGKVMALLDWKGVCLFSDINSNYCLSYLTLKEKGG